MKEQEASVGSFSADILCRDVTNDSLVVIENQLERTDHSHLGQLITYAAGLEANTLVWIVKHFTEEHRAAIDWLNRNTDENFHFFGIEVEVFRIGDSVPAPRFEVVAKPNDWAKTTKQASRSRANFTELQKKYMAFWEVFGDQAAKHGQFKRPKPQPDMWLGWGAGKSDFSFYAQISFRENWLVMDICLSGRNAMAHFHLLKEQQEEIEQELGYQLEWDVREGMKSCSIFIKQFTDLEDRDEWPRHSDWLIKHLADFQKVFRPRVKQLDASEWIPKEEGVFPQ